MDKIKILGVDIDNVDKNSAIKKVNDFYNGDKQHYIVTPNPEIILSAQKDSELFYILSCADLAVPDGIGIKFAGWLLGKNIKRTSGADLTLELLAQANKSGKRVGVLIWEGGFSRKKELEKSFKKKYPNISIVVEEIGRQENILKKKDFLDFRPEIVFVGIGSPWQEKFIYSQIKNISSAKIALGVGGTFDYLTGKKKRAPKILRSVGLEWLWRLAIQPNRFKRIWNATAVFIKEFLKNRFINHFFYHYCVACLLYKKEANDNKNFRYKVLIAEKAGWSGYWQLPQGGTDGDNPMAAGERELKENLNTDKFVPKRMFLDVYHYKFSNSLKNFFGDKERYLGFKGQKQGLFIAEFTGRDEDIKINFWEHQAWKWTDIEKLVGEIHPTKKRSVQIFLKKFKEFVKQK